MTSFAGRVREEMARPRPPLQVRRALLELAARSLYAPAWLAGRLARGAVVVARFAWSATRLGLGDGYGGGPAQE